MFVVKYSGQFGFIRPFSAMRCEYITSQKFISPSTIEGIRIFLNCKGKIIRNKLSYEWIDNQQEVIYNKMSIPLPKKKKGKDDDTDNVDKAYEELYFASENKRNYINSKHVSTSILTRGVMVNPTVYLAFEDEEDAKHAVETHICLCRREDIMFPIDIYEMSDEDFDNLNGVECVEDASGIFNGFNRFTNERMYIKLKY